MGLSFHYSGSFNPGASLNELIEEVKDIAEIYKWEYAILEDRFPPGALGQPEYDQNLYGICFTPPGCETIFLTFLSNGKMTSAIHISADGASDSREDATYLYMLSTKTQYAGAETHKLVIQLMKYISKKYLQDFKLDDEGHYWETGDEKLLQDTFIQYTAMLEGFGATLENYPMREDESFEDYFERLIKEIQKKNKK